MLKQLRIRLIGSREFYKNALAVIIPLMLQNVVTNFVSLLDNVMVGQTGTASMSGVAVVGQLFFIFYLVLFGTISGPGIFCAQFWGAGDMRSFRCAFRYKLFTSLGMCLVCMGVIGFLQEPLVGLYLTGSEEETAEVMGYALPYLRIMLWGMLPYALTQVYASTIREAGNTKLPMIASWVAVAVNLFLNWVLIFGHLGAPVLGVKGAAIATVISRFAELGVNVIWAHTHGDRVGFTQEFFKPLHFPPFLLRQLITKSIPLMLNETLWCIGTAFLNQIYSTRGLDVVAALNIGLVLWDLFTSLAFSVGTSIGIIVAQELGAGELEKAVDTDRKLLALSFFIAAVIAVVMLAGSGLFPLLYNTTDSIRALAAQIVRVMAVALPFDCFAHGCYFTMRSGGKTLVTFLFDSFFSWVVQVPVAYCVAHFTGLPIIPLYIISMATYLIKDVCGFILVRRRYWVNTLANHP